MTVPGFQQMMFPVLMLAADGREHTLREAVEHIAKHFALNAEDRETLLPSGRQTQLENRAGWVTTFFRKARIVESTGRGRFCITDRGRALIAEKPSIIDNHTLLRYPEFQDFRQLRRDGNPIEPAEAEIEASGRSPEEALEISFDALNQSVTQDVLESLLGCTPRRFEQIVVQLLVAMGYGGTLADAGEAVGKSGDEGIDGVIKQDRLGLDRIYVQAKRWKGSVGRPLVQAFSGSLAGHGAQRGVMITTSHFTPDAHDYATKLSAQRIILVDGHTLARLMLDFRVGVTEVATYTVTRVDREFFSDGI